MKSHSPILFARRRALASLPAGAAALWLAAAAFAPTAARGQDPGYYGPPPPSSPAPNAVYYPETAAPPAADPLDQLMGPVALYPDPLIALLLPASAFPSDIADAGAYLNSGGDPGQVDQQPWDASVRSLAHYPDVVKWMAQNGPWTQAVGAAFVSDPSNVMDAIQRLRALANAAGTLTSTPQQQVVVQPDYIEIEPAQPDVIYVPRYDPNIVFVDQPYYGYNGPYFTFGSPYPAGVWLNFGVNWGGRGVERVDYGYWHGSGGWWHPPGPGPGGVAFAASFHASVWSFPANRARPQAPSGWQTRAQVVQPRPIAGAPARPPAAAFINIHTRGAAAVTVVARDPAAFRGRPIGPALQVHASATPPRRPEPVAPRPALPAPLVSRPQPVPPRPPLAPRPVAAPARVEPGRPSPDFERARPAPPEGRAPAPAKAPPPEEKKPAPKAPAKERPSEDQRRNAQQQN
jgi:hypothetical protein